MSLIMFLHKLLPAAVEQRDKDTSYSLTGRLMMFFFPHESHIYSLTVMDYPFVYRGLNCGLLQSGDPEDKINKGIRAFL